MKLHDIPKIIIDNSQLLQELDDEDEFEISEYSKYYELLVEYLDSSLPIDIKFL